MRQESTETDEPNFWAETMLCPGLGATASARKFFPECLIQSVCCLYVRFP